MLKKELFELGRVVMTQRIGSDLGQFVASNYISKHVTGDFGIASDEDVEINKKSIENGGDNIVSVYMHNDKKIMVYTEHDRSVTTVMYMDEY